MDDNEVLKIAMRTPEEIRADTDFIGKVISRLTEENKILTNRLVSANQTIADLRQDLISAEEMIESLENQLSGDER